MLASSPLDPLYKAVGWLIAVLYGPLSHLPTPLGGAALGLSIIVMTIIVMAVQLPLIAKQTRSMILMQRVQPEIKKIQQKYKDDRTKQNEELLKFYQENKINPLAGCLPLLVILPIGIAVLGTFRHGGLPAHVPHNSTLYHSLCGNIQNPSDCSKAIVAHPPSVLNFLGMNLNLSAAQAMKDGFVHAIPYLILLLVVVGTGWYQVRQTQARQSKGGGAPANAQMQAITKIMPIFFGAISYGFVAATTLYFAVSNAWRIGQQHFVLNKMYEEDRLKKGGSDANGKSTDASAPSDEIEPSDDLSSNGDGDKPTGPSSGARRKKKKRKR